MKSRRVVVANSRRVACNAVVVRVSHEQGLLVAPRGVLAGLWGRVLVCGCAGGVLVRG